MLLSALGPYLSNEVEEWVRASILPNTPLLFDMFAQSLVSCALFAAAARAGSIVWDGEFYILVLCHVLN